MKMSVDEIQWETFKHTEMSSAPAQCHLADTGAVTVMSLNVDLSDADENIKENHSPPLAAT